MALTIENKFELIDVYKSGTEPKKDIKVIIRESYNPLSNKPVAVVNCSCNKVYKKKLFYLASSNFSIGLSLKCPNKTCNETIWLVYKKE